MTRAGSTDEATVSDVPPWASSAADVLVAQATDPEAGLSSEEAARRFDRDGPNELTERPPVPVWRRVARQFTDPLVLLLLVAIVISLVAWLTGGGEGVPLEAAVISAIVVLNAGIGTWQESRAIKAVAALQRLAAARSTVVRDGRVEQIAGRDLVAGDVVVLEPGDAVGADCRLVEARSLMIAEAPLTGESAPVEKSTVPVPPETLLADRTDMAYHGTAVTLGRGLGVVVATGMSTEIGRIARLLEESDSEPTPLERQVEWLGKTLGVVVVVLSTIVVGTILFASDANDLDGVIDAALVGVSLAVAAVPEGLPAILTIVLAIGVQRMAANRAIVKQLSSVETLGSASVICSDKTGTLTRNEMSVVAVVTASGGVQLVGVGYEPQGAVLVDGAPLDDDDVRSELEIALMAGSVANDATFRRSDDGSWDVGGDPTELALLVAAERVGVRQSAVTGSRRVGEIPFDSERKLMSTVDDVDVWPVPSDTACHGRVMFTKGAPDVLLERCDREHVKGDLRPLSESRRAGWMASVDGLADDALRPLALAYRSVGDVEADPPVETGLVLLGVVGITDPPRPEAKRAIADAQRGGVRVVMITGDHPRTAVQIARRLDLLHAERVVTGPDVAAMDDEELSTVATSVSVYARVDPEQKLRLVRALQSNGLVTAMTGDGVNDAPALKQADIGIAMGLNGTEVAKEAADMVLADDNFATILAAVREGREIYADIKKFLRYLLASNTGEVLVVVLGVLLAAQLGLDGVTDGLAVPLLATQILWINLVTDGLLALALGVDPSVEDVMSQPPRPLTERVVDAAMLRTITFVGSATAIVSLMALDLELRGGLLGGSGDVETARTMAFTTLVLAQVCNALNARSDVVSAFVKPFDNRMLWLAALLTVAAQVLVVHTPGLRDAFDATPLSAGRWALCAALALVVLVTAEIVKLFVRTRSRARAQ